MKKTLIILKSLIDPRIIDYFEDEFDITDKETEYEFKFKFNNQGEEFEIFIAFKVNERGEYNIDFINDIQVIDKNGLKYSVGNDKKRQEFNQLIILNKSINPNKKTVHEEITAIIDKEKQKLKERKKESEAIDQHNEYLDLNER
jgi:hypothetical protein